MLSHRLSPLTLSLFLALFTLFSCSKDDDSYPSLITEMVMAQADAQGYMVSFTTDGGTTYAVDNSIEGMDANNRLRCLCGYTTEAEGHAKVYSALAVPVLADASGAKSPKRHPTGIASAWLSGGFLNLHLTPKTHGGKQTWGFTCDSVTPHTSPSGAAEGYTYHLSLYHDQRDDATSYTTDLYACIALDSLAAHAPRNAPPAATDSLRLTVPTFNGEALWLFGCSR